MMFSALKSALKKAEIDPVISEPSVKNYGKPD
jgi:hypothetical protein